jgi:cell wall assembly regulator SMI1
MDGLLVRLEAAWSEQGAAITDLLAPGASADEMAAWEDRSGLTLPPELRIWWGWHDGCDWRNPLPGTLRYDGIIGPAADFLSMDEALRARDARLAMNWREPPASDADWEGDWRPDWLPVIGREAHVLFVDCSTVTPSGSVPLRRWDHTPEDVFTPAAASFSHAVASWVDMIEQGFFRWSTDDHGWRYRWLDVPEHLRVGGAVS